MPDQLISMIAFGSLCLAAFGTGRPVLRCLAIAQEDRLSIAVWSLGLGAIGASLGLLGLGWFGGLYVPVIGLLTLFACFWGLAEIFRDLILAADRRAFPPETSFEEEEADVAETPWSPPGRWLRRVLLAMALVACLAALLGSLVPPTAGDGLYVPLATAKAMLLEHRIAPPDARVSPGFPSPTEMWYLWAMALDDIVCAQLVRFGLGVLLALAAVVLATPVVGRPWASIVGGMTFLAPAVSDQIAPSPAGVVTAVFATLALAAWWRVVVDRQGPRWCFLAALAAGGAAIETPAFVLVGLVGVGAWLYNARHRVDRRREKLRLAALMGATVVCVAGPWLALALWHDMQTGVGVSMVEEVARPIDLKTVAVVGLAMASLPGLLFARRLRGLRPLLVAAMLYGLLWVLSDRSVELLCVPIPVIGVAAVWVGIEMRRFPTGARRIAGLAFGCLLGAMAVVGVARITDRAAVAVAAVDRDDYLLLREPTYRAAAVVNAMMQPGTHVLSEDDRTLYFNSRVTRGSARGTAGDNAARIEISTDRNHTLLAEGFTHLLLIDPMEGQPEAWHSLAQWITASRSTDRPTTLIQYASRRDGRTYRYSLVEILDRP